MEPSIPALQGADEQPRPRTPHAARPSLARAAAVAWTLAASGHPGDALAWLRSLRCSRSGEPLPGLTFGATRAICAALPAQARVFAFGAGRSTLFWARRAASVCAVEADARRIARLKARLKALRISNTHLIHADDKDAYAATIAAWPDEHFDLVVVDGAWRRQCIAAALRRVKKGGLLAVDNTDWPWFQAAQGAGVPPDWPREAYTGYAPASAQPGETTVFRRPA